MPKAKKLTAAQSSSLKVVRQRAFDSGVARSAVVAATFAACGKKPVMALYQAARLSLQIGFMGAALVRKGDNREPTAIMADCLDKIENYAGHGGTGKLRKGQKGRRTKVEEEAYASARVSVSGIMKDAGITVPEARGGNTSKTRKPQAGKKATSGKAKETKPTAPRIKTADQLIEYFHLQAKALQSVLSRNAPKLSADPRVSELTDALQPFVAKVTGII